MKSYGCHEKCFKYIWKSISLLLPALKSLIIKFIKIGIKIVTICLNKCMTNESFPDELKIAVVVPIFQKNDLNDKTNYQPISLLPLISNIF